MLSEPDPRPPRLTLSVREPSHAFSIGADHADASRLTCAATLQAQGLRHLTALGRPLRRRLSDPPGPPPPFFLFSFSSFSTRIPRRERDLSSRGPAWSWP
eukprot:3490375-Rhodomonas_salina.2